MLGEGGGLLQAMESGVRTVILGALGEVTHDIWVLTEYNGQGKCSKVVLYRGTAARYREEIRAWDRSGHMIIAQDSKSYIRLENNISYILMQQRPYIGRI